MSWEELGGEKVCVCVCARARVMGNQVFDLDILSLRCLLAVQKKVC